MYADNSTIIHLPSESKDYLELNISYTFQDDKKAVNEELIRWHLEDPDSDGNYYIHYNSEDWGWFAVIKNSSKLKRSPYRLSRRCPTGYRKNRSSGKCVKK